MNFELIFINSLYLLLIVIVCTLIYCIIAGVAKQIITERYKRKLEKEFDDYIVKKIIESKSNERDIN